MSAAANKPLRGKVCLVTGGSRGIGKGIAEGLAEAGATVYITGRSVQEFSVEKRLPGTIANTARICTELGGVGIAMPCDHADDAQNKQLVEKILAEQNGKLDLLVNCAFCMPKPAGDFFGKDFWAQDAPRFWDEQSKVGLRNHLVMSALCAPALIRSKGAIVCVSSPGGQLQMQGFPVTYFMIKAALDRMCMAMADQLTPHGVCVVALWPGVVQTERMLAGADLMGGKDVVMAGETPRFSGRVVAALLADSTRMARGRSGRIWTTVRLGIEYGVVDEDGRKHAMVADMEPLLPTAGSWQMKKQKKSCCCAGLMKFCEPSAMMWLMVGLCVGMGLGAKICRR